jgi:signal transduction histidine kinase
MTAARPQPSGKPTVEQVVTRLFRHEVGDLLQSIYSTVAILSERLPPGLDLEGRLLADLKARAEAVRLELDAAVDLVTSPVMSIGQVELTAVAGAALRALQPRFPALRLLMQADGPVVVLGDARLLGELAGLLLRGACQPARTEVGVALSAREGRAEWTVERDGPAMPQDLLAWLARPFPSTHHALPGLGLALATRVAALLGGEASAGPRPEGGAWVRVVLPLAAAQGESGWVCAGRPENSC